MAREVPKLEGWLTFPEAGEVIGVTKQAVHKMAFPDPDEDGNDVPGEFPSLRGVGSKPVYVIAEHEVLAKKQSRFDKALQRQQRREAEEAAAAEKKAAKLASQSA